MNRAALALACLCVVLDCGRELAQAPRGPVHAQRRPRPTQRGASPEPFRTLRDGLRLAEVERPYEGRRERVIILRVDLAKTALDVEAVPEQRFEALASREDIDFAINGGFFEGDFSPSGLAMRRGTVLSPLRRRGGSGVVVVEGGVARLLPFDAASAITDAEIAIQCGPRLIEPDGAIGIASESPQRARRSALCIRDAGRTLDLVVVAHPERLGGPGLRTLAAWLHEGLPRGEAGCEAALNLDGGPSTGMHVRGVPSAGVVPYGPVVQALVGRARRR